MLNDKALGPNDFNGKILKLCWNIVKHDFCNLFYEGNVNLESINSSFIALIPKVNNPDKVSNFRPISLLSIAINLITKLLANRPQPVIQRIAHKIIR